MSSVPTSTDTATRVGQSRPAGDRQIEPARRFRFGNPLLLALPAVLLVVVFGVYPLVTFLVGSVRSRQGFTVDRFVELLTTDYFIQILGRTLLTALAVTVITLVLAYPTAYALRKANGTVKILLIALTLLPYLTSVLVRVYAWSALLATNGPVNSVLVSLGVFAEPKLLGHSIVGTALGMIHIQLPIAVLTLWSRLEKVDPLQQEVAMALGASRVQSFLTVFLPQSVSGVVGAGILVYVLSLGAYVIPAALGGTNGLLFAQVVADQATQLLNWELAGAMGVLMLLTAAIPAALAWLVRLGGSRRTRRPVISQLQRLSSNTVMPVLDLIPTRAYTIVWRAVAVLVFAFLLLPELVILIFSLGPESSVTLPPESYSLAGFRSVLTDADWTGPLTRSLQYAAVDAVIVTVVGVLAAYAFARGNARFARLGMTLLLIPIVLPEIVLAIAYYVFSNEVGIAGTGHGIVLGQAMAAVGLVVVILTNVVREVDESLEWAAQMCGASRWRAIREIVLPLIAPGLLVGLVYGFLHAFDNLVLPLFIAGTRSTITVRMFQSIQESVSSAPAVIAALLIVALMVIIALAVFVQRRGKLSLLPQGQTRKATP